MEHLTTLQGGYYCCLKEVRKPRLREVMCHARSPPTTEWQSWAPSAVLFPMRIAFPPPRGVFSSPSFPCSIERNIVCFETWSASTYSKLLVVAPRNQPPALFCSSQEPKGPSKGCEPSRRIPSRPFPRREEKDSFVRLPRPGGTQLQLSQLWWVHAFAWGFL